MRKLFAFLIKYSVLLLFLILEIAAFSLIVHNNGYQKSVFFSSGNTVLASMYAVSNSVVDFFYLRSANEILTEENTELQNRVIQLQNRLAAIETSHISRTRVDAEKEIYFINAKVINNSTNKMKNYITINKGARDGIRVDMGVINEEGVVGIISHVSEKFSVIIPILNPKIKINSRFTHNNYSGPIHWKGGDYRYAKLDDIARHVTFALGDSLVTSSYTAHTFPEGILVGTVDDFNLRESDAYFDITIKLAVNFRTLSHVKVIQYLNFLEQKDLESEAFN